MVPIDSVYGQRRCSSDLAYTKVDLSFCCLNELLRHLFIWAAWSKVPLSITQTVRMHIILHMCNVSSGHLLSIRTFYSIQRFCLQTMKAPIRLCVCSGWSGPSLPTYAWRHIFAWCCPYGATHAQVIQLSYKQVTFFCFQPKHIFFNQNKLFFFSYFFTKTCCGYLLEGAWKCSSRKTVFLEK